MRTPCIELTEMNIYCERQKPIQVYYKEKVVGNYFADLLVEEYVIVELKAAEALVPDNENQLINYLKATELEVGLLLNFGPKPNIVRKVFSNDRKNL